MYTTSVFLMNPIRKDSDMDSKWEGRCWFIPGPTRLTDAVLAGLSHPTMTHRSPEFKSVMAELHGRLRHSFALTPTTIEVGQQAQEGEDGYSVVVVSGSGTAAMEMVIANRFGSNDNVLVPTNGKFGERVAQLCQHFANLTHLKYAWGQPFDLGEIDTMLSTGKHDALAICHNETSSGITQNAPEIAKIAEKHGIPFILDGITSVGGLPVHPAEWNAEAVVVGGQKCTAGPSGIAAVAVSEHFVEAMMENRKTNPEQAIYYLDLIQALKKAADDQTPWTPSINLCTGWVASLREQDEEGMEERWTRCARLAKGVRNLFSDLGFELFAHENQRSDTVTAILYPDPSWGEEWRRWMTMEQDTHVIGGQDHVKGRIFRVGSMGVTPIEEMVEGCRRMIEGFRHFGMELPDLDVESYFR
ncbi:MAG TPA: alanine--glyoxylate aminotransferase family protein [Candidatus Poseidoniales archaeon]|nr:MAG TPA: alanine--glyoxylate aminotransferase family protein [Candidatus Poseidoniales archaeon]